MGYLYNSVNYVSKASSAEDRIFVQKLRINTAPQIIYRFPQLGLKEV